MADKQSADAIHVDVALIAVAYRHSDPFRVTTIQSIGPVISNRDTDPE